MIKHLEKRFSNDLLRARLDQIINMKNELVQLARKIDWDWMTARSRRSTARTPARDQDPVCDRAMLLKRI
jgi:hypothetical protein